CAVLLFSILLCSFFSLHVALPISTVLISYGFINWPLKESDISAFLSFSALCMPVLIASRKPLFCLSAPKPIQPLFSFTFFHSVISEEHTTQHQTPDHLIFLPLLEI